MCIPSKAHAYLQSLVKTSLKFKTNRNETVGGVAHTRYPLSIHVHCQNARKMTKPHAYLQRMVKTSVKFQKNRVKL